LRRIRCAQAGGLDPLELGVGAAASPPLTVPFVEEPPVAAKLDLAPAAKLSRIEPAA
jgi:hypothetical protein